jgi:hypothetical protein
MPARVNARRTRSPVRGRTSVACRSLRICVSLRDLILSERVRNREISSGYYKVKLLLTFGRGNRRGLDCELLLLADADGALMVGHYRGSHFNTFFVSGLRQLQLDRWIVMNLLSWVCFGNCCRILVLRRHWRSHIIWRLRAWTVPEAEIQPHARQATLSHY